MSRSPRVARAALLVALVWLPACQREPSVQVPPRVDLAAWPVIGIVEFGGASRAEYSELATRHFVEMLHAAKPGVRILELGSERRVLDEIGRTELDFEAVRALGERYEVDAVFTGELTLSALKPHVNVSQYWDAVRAGAGVRGELTARLFETRSGATLWSRVSNANAEVAHFSLPAGSSPSIGAVDPSDANTLLVRRLVAAQSGDFYPTWVKL
jgi:hypothetical protein